MKSTLSIGSLTMAFSLVALVGCSGGDGDTNASASSEIVTSSQCTAKINATVLDKARALSETAELRSTTTLYGNDFSYADAVLVRVSDETEPTDYIVVRSRLRNDIVSPNECSIEETFLIADGSVPGDSLIHGTIGDHCKASLHAAVLDEAKKVDEIAEVTGSKLIYGGDLTFGGAALVRVSDETEPSDYLAVFTLSGSEQRRSGQCKVEFVKILNSGVLPHIDGL